MPLKKEKIKDKYSSKDVCNILDSEEKRYKNWEWKNYNTIEILERIKNRKNTFLTSK